MASQAVTSGAAKNNGSTIANAGNIPVTNKTTNDAGFGTVIGVASGGTPKVVEQSGTTGNFSSPGLGGRETAKGSGTFAFENKAGKFIMLRVTDTINEVDNTSLLSGGSAKGQFRGSIHALESYHTLPKYTKNADGSHASTTSAGGSATNYIDSAGNGSTASSDSAANPTRAIPGELVYTDTSKARSGSLASPKQDDYKPKTG